MTQPHNPDPQSQPIATAAVSLETMLESITSRAPLIAHLKNCAEASGRTDITIRAAFEMLECAVALRLQRSEIPGPPCLEALLTLCSALPNPNVPPEVAYDGELHIFGRVVAVVHRL